VNISLSVVTTTLLMRRFGHAGVELAIAVSTLAVLVVGEVTPKTLAINYPEAVSRLSVDPFRFLRACLRPLTAGISFLSGFLLRALGLQPIPIGRGEFISRAELGTLLEGADEEGVMNARESRLVQRILDFSKRRVGEIMTPRVDVTAAPANSDRARLETLVTRARHSRIPIYERTIDEVVGYLKVRDFLLDPDRPLRALILPVPVVPESAPAAKVFYEMQRRRTSMAVVVNEYGETVGLLTREDLIEEVVGEIFDEYEPEEGPIRREAPGIWVAEGRIRLDEINEELDLHLPEEEAITLSGFLTGLHGGLPRRGDRIVWEGVEFTILEVSRHRIARCRVRIGGDLPGAEAAG
jgi:putative hemolysin